MSSRVELEILTLGERDYVTLTAYQELEGALRATNTDMKELRKNGAVTDAEVSGIAQLRQEHLQMKEELDQIAVFIRTNYAREIQLGQHNNMRTVADAALFYMGRERLMSQQPQQDSSNSRMPKKIKPNTNPLPKQTGSKLMGSASRKWPLGKRNK